MPGINIYRAPAYGDCEVAPFPALTGREGRAQRGTVLIVTMWIMLVLAGLVIVFARSMRVEVMASANQLDEAKAEWIARAGLAFVIAQVESADSTEQPGAGVSGEAVRVGDGYFWLLYPDPDDYENYGFGIADEAAKLNLNTATEDMLLKLPRMTSEFAAAIVDWCSPDTAATSGGVGSEYYLQLSPAYYCKHAPLETVEEVLLVKGASMGIVFGNDINRNGVFDSEEQTGTNSGVFDINDWKGFYDFVTVYSAGDESVSRSGRPAGRAGLVNVNNAPWQVLYCLPGLDESDAKALVAKRSSVPNSGRTDWVADVLPAAKYQAVRNLITGVSHQFSADIVAVSGDGRAFKRFRAALDARTSPPRVVCWQELTGLGWPLSPKILTDLREGKEPPTSSSLTTSGGLF